MKTNLHVVDCDSNHFFTEDVRVCGVQFRWRIEFVDISLLSRPLSFCFHINTGHQGKGGNIETVLIFLPEKVDKICFSK
jgi:hypothetical protein